MYNPGIEHTGSYRLQWFRRQRANLRQWIYPANMIGLAAGFIALICLIGLPQDQYWNIRIPLYLIAVIWTIVRPRAALYLLPFAIPWGTTDFFSVSSSISASDILVALLAAGWLLGYVLRPYMEKISGPLDRESTQVPRYLVAAMLLLFMAMLLSTVGAISISTSLKELLKWIELGIVVLLGGQYIRTREQIWLLVACIILATLTQSIEGYQQEFLSIGPSSFIRNDSLRVYGEFGQPNPFAGYINMALTICIALLFLGTTRKLRVLAGLATVLLGGVEYFTESKGGWLAIIVAVFFILIMGQPKIRVWLSAIGIGLLGVIEGFLAGKIPEQPLLQVLNKIGAIGISFTNPSTDNYANSERVAHWYVGIQIFINHPFLGVGMGNYANDYAPYAPGIFVLPLGHAHDYYINIAAEAGIAGLLTFLFLIIAIFVACGKAYNVINRRYRQQQAKILTAKSSNKGMAGRTQVQTQQIRTALAMYRNDRALAIGLLAGIISVCVHNLVDNLFVHGMTMEFGLMIILLIRLGALYRAQEQKTEKQSKKAFTGTMQPAALIEA